MERTVVIINADAESQLTGKVNTNNSLAALKADNPLRMEQEYQELVMEAIDYGAATTTELYQSKLGQ